MRRSNLRCISSKIRTRNLRRIVAFLTVYCKERGRQMPRRLDRRQSIYAWVKHERLNESRQMARGEDRIVINGQDGVWIIFFNNPLHNPCHGLAPKSAAMLAQFHAARNT